MVKEDFACVRCARTTARSLSQRSSGVLAWTYRGHADPSKSQANFAVAIAHTEPFRHPDGQVWHHVLFDHLKVWRPHDYPDSQIPYDDIQEELADLITGFANLKVFSYDQYGSFVTVPLLRRELTRRHHRARVREEMFTERANTVRAERFKAAAGMGWVHVPRDDFGSGDTSLLDQEPRFLQEVQGRIKAQTIGPVRTKDLADCVMVVTSELLADQLERLLRRERLGQTRPAIGAPGSHLSGRESRGGEGTRDGLNRLQHGSAHTWVGSLRQHGKR